MTEASAASLERIEAYIAISKVKARYCRFLDTKDWESFRGLMTADFTLDVSDGTDMPLIQGPEEAIGMICRSIGEAVTAHQVHSPEIELDGDEAAVIWAMQDRLVYGPGKPSLTGFGHYFERYRRVDGEWKITSLRLKRLHLDIERPGGKAA